MKTKISELNDALIKIQKITATYSAILENAHEEDRPEFDPLFAIAALNSALEETKLVEKLMEFTPDVRID